MKKLLFLTLLYLLVVSCEKTTTINTSIEVNVDIDTIIIDDTIYYPVRPNPPFFHCDTL